MRAVVLHKFGAPDAAFDIRERPDPVPAAYQVRIKVEAFGLNFADVLARKGLYPDMPELPCTLGYEVIGVIDSQGEDVPNDMRGKRVVALTRFGGYAELALTDYRAAAEIPNSYPAEKALALGTQATTAWLCFHENCTFRRGDRVLVHAAAGGVGNILCQLALNAGCEVFGTAGSEKKLKFLNDLGVQHPINYREKDYAERIKEIIGNEKIDGSFNSLAGKTVKNDLRLLGRGGKLVLFGAASRVGKSSGTWGKLRLLFDTGFLTPLSLIMTSKSIIGLNVLKIGDRKPEVVAEALSKVVASAMNGTIEPLVGGTYPITEINDAHLALENRQTMGKLSVFWKD